MKFKTRLLLFTTFFFQIIKFFDTFLLKSIIIDCQIFNSILIFDFLKFLQTIDTMLIYKNSIKKLCLLTLLLNIKYKFINQFKSIFIFKDVAICNILIALVIIWNYFIVLFVLFNCITSRIFINLFYSCFFKFKIILFVYLF